MKKQRGFFLLAVAFAASVLFTACPQPDDDDDTPTFEHKTSDWLVLLYADADNNLNDAIWFDMLSTEYALSVMRSESGYPSLNAVMLWDGQSQTAASEDRNTRLHPESALYELGALDYATFTGVLNKSITGWKLSANAIDMTSTASSWLSSEPDMGNVTTLTNFLSWSKEYFSAEHIVLMMNNHGAGTEYESKSGGAYARSLCSDDTNASERMLTATDVASAISASGVDVDVIWMDCCLQSTAETAYLLRGAADYLVTSANVSYPNDYSIIFPALEADSTPLDFVKNVVAAYAENLDGCNMKYSEGDRASFDTMLTQTACSISTANQNALYAAIDALSEALLSDGDTVCSAVYANYLVQDAEDISACKGMAYSGSYAYLNDIGYFCRNLINDTTAGVSDTTKTAAETVQTCLDAVIVASWGGKTGSGAFNSMTGAYASQSDSILYVKNVPSVSDEPLLSSEDGSFGLTIATQLYFDDFDTTYLPLYSRYADVTGYSSNWGALMKKWHGID